MPFVRSLVLKSRRAGVYVAGAIGGSVSQGLASFDNLEGDDPVTKAARKVANLAGIGSFLTGVCSPPYHLPASLLH
jgi:hypothetical protein